MPSLPWLALLACSPPDGPKDTPPVDDADADTDSDADSDSDSDTDADTDTDFTTGATAATGDTGLSLVYTGTLHVDIEELGFAVKNDGCDAAMTLMVFLDGTTPAVQGEGACTMAGELAGNPVRLIFTGDPPVGASYSGTTEVQYQGLPAPDAFSPWSGTLAAGTLIGTTHGAWDQGSAGVHWDALFTLAEP